MDVSEIQYDMDFHYRTSFLQKNPGYVCLETTLILKKGNQEEIPIHMIANSKVFMMFFQDFYANVVNK